jgi:uncharacterized membrane protein (GlpM family)
VTVTVILTVVIKACSGGLLVVAFALVGHVLEPKRFAGLFSAAPSVALASLTVVLATKGHGDARDNALGMIVGAVGFVVFAVVARRLVARFDAAAGSALACVLWLAVAGLGYGIALR